MKKIILIFLFAINIVAFATISYEDFPYKDPYLSTAVGPINFIDPKPKDFLPPPILRIKTVVGTFLRKFNLIEKKENKNFAEHGSSISRAINVDLGKNSYYELTIRRDLHLPPQLGHEYNFKFSLLKHNEDRRKHPLVFLIAGTGDNYQSLKIKNLEKIFFQAGYDVVPISSSTTTNFILNASKNGITGYLPEDSKDIYNVMQLILNKIKPDVNTSEYYMVGYSLGATQAAFVSYLDSKEKKINFKRTFMINPPVDLLNSTIKLDNLIDENLSKEDVSEIINKFSGDSVISIETSVNNKSAKISTNFKIKDLVLILKNAVQILFDAKNAVDNGTSLSPEYQKQLKYAIGGVFRIVAAEMKFTYDSIDGKNKGVPKPEFLINFLLSGENSRYEMILNAVVIPYYKKQNLSKQQIINGLKLKSIENFLKNYENIAVVTNKDEIILDEDEIKYLQKVFGDRMILYPYGGHCGNMFFYENIDDMLRYLRTGKFTK